MKKMFFMLLLMLGIASSAFAQKKVRVNGMQV